MLTLLTLDFFFTLQATSRLRERGCDGCLAGIEVQQLFCSQSVAIPEHQLKELNMKIDSALQVVFQVCCFHVHVVQSVSQGVK